MKISALAQDITPALQVASRISATRASVEALSGVLITAQEGKITIAASNQEQSISLPLTGSIQEDGEVVVPARLLLDVVRQLPGDKVELILGQGESELTVKGGSSKFNLRVLRAEDFPLLPDPLKEGGISLPATEFLQSIGRVSRSASRDETRPMLTGVLINASGDELTMVATDSYRLALKKTILPGPISQDFEANIPAKALEELGRIAKADEQLTLIIQESQAIFLVGEATFYTGILSGQFPDFRKLIPEEYEHELEMPTHLFLEVARRVSLMARQGAPVRLSFSEGKAELSAQTPDIGEASEAMEVPFSGEAMEIGFAPEFLLAGLESAACENISFKLISPIRPGLIVSADDSGFLYLLMPIRLNA